ncbi:hypothetical protein Tco_1113847 [Tanacetum coccineum]|uniref:Reverse transcriptase Ty1/copia-type domain-containing protein n=1 Tax=Tanacetum coccineum TaxID=301880 RepID=A0ABQ5IX21_9ASTR
MPVSELRQKGVYEESFSRHAAWIGEKLIQLMHIKMVQEQEHYLQLEDVEGVDCLPNAAIFKQLALMGKQRQCNIVGPNPRQTLIDTKISIRTSLGSGPRRQETMVDTISQTRSENVSKHSNDLLLAGVNTPQSGEDNASVLRSEQSEKVVETEVAAVKDVNLSVNEVTLAQVLAALKSAKPKATITPTKTTIATTITPTSIRSRAKGIVFHDQEQAPTPTPIVSSQQPSQDKGKGKDNTLFTKKSKSHLIIVQIYVDDIIFSSMSQNLCDDFAKIMHDEFEMSMMGS